ncbi:MAG: hypothetical protein J0M00_01550 [Burkholderiales bacterium]|nr:hypothetical protein [Burkholderiales bacterium]
MKFQSRITVFGMKASKGDYEGVEFDSTKVYTLTSMDESKGNMKGQACVEYTLGLSEEYDKFKHLPFPFDADAEFEIVTTGKASKTVLRTLRPVEAKLPKP